MTETNPSMPVVPIRGICSMAPAGLLAELAFAYARLSGIPTHFQAVGGVDAARMISEGRPCDVVVLASDAIARLAEVGRVDRERCVDLVRSEVGAVVSDGSKDIDISTEERLRTVILQARRIAISTGPSGTALLEMFARWGVSGTLRDRLIQARPGVPVGTLVANGEAALGFQQMSELVGLTGIQLLGPLPQACRIVTVFSAAAVVGARRLDSVVQLLSFLASRDVADVKRRHGMSPA